MKKLFIALILLSSISSLHCMNDNNNAQKRPSHPLIKAFYDNELQINQYTYTNTNLIQIKDTHEGNMLFCNELNIDHKTLYRLQWKAVCSLFFEVPLPSTKPYSLHSYKDGKPYGSASETITSFSRGIKFICQNNPPDWTQNSTIKRWLESQKNNSEFQELTKAHLENNYFQENEKNYSLGFLYELCTYESEITQKIKERAQESSSNQDEK